jgi:hypothetical protein
MEAERAGSVSGHFEAWKLTHLVLRFPFRFPRYSTGGCELCWSLKMWNSVSTAVAEFDLCRHIIHDFELDDDSDDYYVYYLARLCSYVPE